MDEINRHQELRLRYFWKSALELDFSCNLRPNNDSKFIFEIAIMLFTCAGTLVNL